MNAHVKQAGIITLDTISKLDNDGNDRSGHHKAYEFKTVEQLHATASQYDKVERNSTNGLCSGKNYTLEMAKEDFDATKNADVFSEVPFAYAI